MVQPKTSELHGVQMLRGVAAMAVVVHHTLEQSNGAAGRFCPDWLTTVGASGVDIFFVISGFIMLHVSFLPGRASPTPISFLVRRAIRIYPFYWLCCLAMVLLKVAGFLASHPLTISLLTSSIMLIPGEKLIGVSWTLVFEVYFYVIFAATLYYRSWVVSMVGTASVIAVGLLAGARFQGSAAVEFIKNPLSIEFCFGLIIAAIYAAVEREGKDWPAIPTAAIVGLVLLTAASVLVPHPDTTGLPPAWRVVVWGIPASMIVAGCLAAKSPRNAITQLLVKVGDASYAYI